MQDPGLMSLEYADFCIYVHGPKTIENLRDFVSEFNLSPSILLNFIESKYVRRNKGKSTPLGGAKTVTPNDFCDFDWLIENSEIKNVTPEQLIETLNLFLQALWQKGWAAICSCDFEHLLIHEGGYKAKTPPWLEYYSKLESDQ